MKTWHGTHDDGFLLEKYVMRITIPCVSIYRCWEGNYVGLIKHKEVKC